MPADEVTVNAGQTLAPTDQQSSAANESTSEATPAQARTITASPLFWLAVLAALNLLGPFVPVPNYSAFILGVIVITVLYVVAVVQFAAHVTRWRLSLAQLLLWTNLSLLLWIALQNFVAPMLARDFLAVLQKTRGHPSTLHLLPIVAFGAVLHLSFLCTAVLGGRLLSPLIKSPNLLGPICAMLIMIDVWSVLFGGIAAQMLEKTPHIANKAMTQLPAVGAATEAATRFAIPQFRIGAADYLFLGLLFAVLHAHRMNWRGAVKLTIPLVALVLLATTITDKLPGLVPIGLGVALPNLKYCHYTREEKFALLYAAIFVIILTIALYFGVTSLLPEK